MGLFDAVSRWLPDPTVEVPTYVCDECRHRFEVPHETCPECEGDLRIDGHETVPMYWGYL